MKNSLQIKYFILILGGVLISSCTDHRSLPPKYEAETYCIDEDFKDEIVLRKPELEPITEKMHLTGKIEPNPERVVHFASLVDGLISKTHFSEGDVVQEGQVLIELRSSELADLYAQQRIIDSQIEVAERSEEHTSELQSRGHLVCRLLLEKK